MKDNFTSGDNPFLSEMCDLILMQISKDIGIMALLMFQKMAVAKDEDDKARIGFESLGKAALCGSSWIIDCQRSKPQLYAKIADLYKKGIENIKSKES